MSNCGHRDFLGGIPPRMDAKLCGVKAVNVLKAISGLFLLSAVVYLICGLVSGNLSDAVKMCYDPAFYAFVILVSVYLLKSSYVYICCSVCGVLQLCNITLVLLIAIAYVLLISSGFFDVMRVYSLTSLTTTTVGSSENSASTVLVCIVVFGSIVFHIVMFTLCAAAFWVLSGITAKDRYDVENGDLVKSFGEKSEKSAKSGKSTKSETRSGKSSKSSQRSSRRSSRRANVSNTKSTGEEST